MNQLFYNIANLNARWNQLKILLKKWNGTAAEPVLPISRCLIRVAFGVCLLTKKSNPTEKVRKLSSLSSDMF